MAATADDKHREDLLAAAMELLGDVENKFGLFERQRYWPIRKQFEQRQALPENMREGLNEIETE